MRTEIVTTLKRKATDLGIPAAYLVDVESYQRMESRVKMLEGIALGEKAIFEGRTVKQSDAKQRMSRWLK